VGAVDTVGDPVGTIVVGATVGIVAVGSVGDEEGTFIDMDMEIDMSIHGKSSKSRLWVPIVREKC
jgi:hypothetical protein